MLVLIGVLAVIVQEASGSSVQQVARLRIDELEQRIEVAELGNQQLAERLTYAQSLAALREIAKHELGLVDPGDQAVVLLDEATDRSTAAPLPIPKIQLPEPEPIEFGYFGAWIRMLFGG